MKALNVLGLILFFFGLALVLHAQINLETKIDFALLSEIDGYVPLEDKMSNIGLIYEKLNLTIVGGIILISGLVMACAVEGKKKKL